MVEEVGEVLVRALIPRGFTSGEWELCPSAVMDLTDLLLVSSIELTDRTWKASQDLDNNKDVYISAGSYSSQIYGGTVCGEFNQMTGRRIYPYIGQGLRVVLHEPEYWMLKIPS